MAQPLVRNTTKSPISSALYCEARAKHLFKLQPHTAHVGVLDGVLCVRLGSKGQDYVGLIMEHIEVLHGSHFTWQEQ